MPDSGGEGAGPVVLAVADGLGGGPAGDVASRLAVGAVAERATTTTSAHDLVAAAADAVRSHIAEHGRRRPELFWMGTTLTLGVANPNGTLEIGHVGDSRGHLFRAGELTQVTDDHSVAMDMVRAGTLDPSDASHHPQWDTLSNWLGSEVPRIETRSILLERDDRILLCSDGLTNMLDDDAIARLLADHPEDGAGVRALIDAANAAGGRDNITVVLLTVDRA